MDDRDADAFLAAARIAGELATRPEVAARWTDESACAGMSVGGLAHHLVGQAVTMLRLLTAAPSEEQPIGVIEHYDRAAWVHSSLDDEVNVGIREGSDAEAAGGPDALKELLDSTLADLPTALRAPRDPDTVHIPWQGWSLTSHDWVVTRLMEIVVHADDLAASIDVPTPEFPEDVVTPVITLLAGVSVRRHGQAAVVRALSRPQRAPGSVSAF
ncbi:maleylpyruvate isomerase N-terminal domain-containing protein [Nocardioides sp. MAHUQ-72]|uniref:maleylpyruvate isomerase N-terminal domain-containing protein n=1 Tax=unclassified Nocardioides TaxID=2615069 RepID=UPI00360DBC64